MFVVDRIEELIAAGEPLAWTVKKCLDGDDGEISEREQVDAVRGLVAICDEIDAIEDWQ